MGTTRFRTLVALIATTTIFFATCATGSEASSSNGLTNAQQAILDHSPIFFDIGRRLH